MGCWIIDEHPPKEKVHHTTNHYVISRSGDLRKSALKKMRLCGRLETIQAGQFKFADDLKNNLDQADATAARIKKNVDDYIESQDTEAATEESCQPLWEAENPASPLQPVILIGCGHLIHWFEV